MNELIHGLPNGERIFIEGNFFFFLNKYWRKLEYIGNDCGNYEKFIEAKDMETWISALTPYIPQVFIFME